LSLIQEDFQEQFCGEIVHVSDAASSNENVLLRRT
jgi:hypothetical protein